MTQYFSRRKKEFLLLFGTLVFIVLSLEIFARVYFFGPLALIPVYANSVMEIVGGAYAQPSEHKELGYELKPNLNTYFKLVKFQTNSRGLRDKEYSLNKPENTYRVVVLGDSFTMPAGVDIDKAWHSLLEEYFNRIHPEKKYEFINFGVAGYTLKQYLATLKYKALEYRPDHILVGICLANDVPQKNEVSFFRYHRRRPPREPFFQSWAYVFLKEKFEILFKKVVRIKNRANKVKFESKAKQESGYDLERMEIIVSEFRKIADENNIGVTFVALNHLPQFKRNKANARLFKQVTEKFNIPYIDTAPAFEGMGIERVRIYRRDTHPNAYANSIFADVIKNSLKLD